MTVNTTLFLSVCALETEIVVVHYLAYMIPKAEFSTFFLGGGLVVCNEVDHTTSR